jgi:hypothetical protein
MRENWKRILIGLLAVFLIGQLTSYFLPAYESSESDSLADVESHIFLFVAIAYILSFIGMVIGGFVAQKKFLVPAMIYATVESAYGAVRGYMGAYNSWQEYDQLGNSIEHGEILPTVVWSVLPQFLIFLALAAAGAAIGMRIFRTVESRLITD